MARYKWASPGEWLRQKIQTAASENDVVELMSICNTLLPHVDNDTIQDEFQSDMDSDGFFQDLDITEKLTARQCMELLIEAGEDEGELVDGPATVEQMRQMVQQAIDLGDIAYDEVEELVK